MVQMRSCEIAKGYFAKMATGMRPRRRFVGAALKALRHRMGLAQGAMAARLGLSVSYISQLESDDRPITPQVAARLAEAFPLDWTLPEGDELTRRIEALRAALDAPLFDGLEPPDQPHRIAEQQPALVDRLVRLHTAWRQAEARRQIADEALSSGVQGGARLPWEEVRDWFHDEGNYIDALDRAAEALAEAIGIEPLPEDVLTGRLGRDHGVVTRLSEADDGDQPLRRFDPLRGLLVLDRVMPAETRRFLIAQQLAQMEFARLIDAIAAAASLSGAARDIVRLGLANYAAGALLMPYERFRRAARELRHDIDRLSRRYGVSFEQACHRLSTLQRPGARGIPMFFCRVDMAGNITKRHSATRLQFARFGGACPLWVVHEAVAIPDRILVQLAETPDGVRYVSMAKGLVKPSGSFARSPRRYAVALGCEAEHAADFIYADGLDLANPAAATPIGVSCRLCPRPDCDQRAFPPAERLIAIDPNLRDVVPYRVGALTSSAS